MLVVVQLDALYESQNPAQGMQKITPSLWYDGNAEEAVNFYLSVFPKSRILSTARYGDAGPGPKGGVRWVWFELAGQRFLAINGGPEFKFTPAVSLLIDCKDQKEVDHYWDKLLADGGEPDMCGWLRDKYGLSWQVAPSVLDEMLLDKDPVKAQRAMEAMLKMRKIDIAELERAVLG